MNALLSLEQLLNVKEPETCSDEYLTAHGEGCDYVFPLCQAHEAYVNDVRAFDKLLSAKASELVRIARLASELERGCDCEYDYRCGRCDTIVTLQKAVKELRDGGADVCDR